MRPPPSLVGYHRCDAPKVGTEDGKNPSRRAAFLGFSPSLVKLYFAVHVPVVPGTTAVFTYKQCVASGPSLRKYKLLTALLARSPFTLSVADKFGSPVPTINFTRVLDAAANPRSIPDSGGTITCGIALSLQKFGRRVL
jgi:hypothetical protein